jgi:3-methylcrotonyl-CoA carboxylase beta subunit
MEFPKLYQAPARALLKTRPHRFRQCIRCVATHTHSFHANQISVIRSKVDTSSEIFKENAQQMEAALQRIRELKMAAAQGGPPKNREKHVARGKMLPRE